MSTIATDIGTTWTICFVLSAVLLIFGLWYVVSVTLYLKRNTFLCKFICQYDKFTISKMMVLSGLLYVFALLFQIISINTPFIAEQGACALVCEVCTDISLCLLAISWFVVYLYLWLRMKSFY